MAQLSNSDQILRANFPHALSLGQIRGSNFATKFLGRLLLVNVLRKGYSGLGFGHICRHPRCLRCDICNLFLDIM